MSALLASWIGSFLVVVGGCLTHCRLASIILDLYPPCANSTFLLPHPVVTTKDVSIHCQVSLGGKSYPWLRTTASEVGNRRKGLPLPHTVTKMTLPLEAVTVETSFLRMNADCTASDSLCLVCVYVCDYLTQQSPSGTLGEYVSTAFT